jgi:hypothetical protein
MNFILHLSLCGVLLLVTIGVVFYKKWLEDHCDHYIHLHDDQHDTGVINSQQELVRRMEQMGRLQVYLIAATAAYAVIIAAAAIYSAWMTAGSPT